MTEKTDIETIEADMPIEEAVRQLAEMREVHRTHQDKYLIALAEFEKANEDLIRSLSLAKQDMIMQADLIKDKALMDFKIHENTSWAGGQVYATYKKQCQYDAQQAFEWAKSHNLCLKQSLDATAFEKGLKAKIIDFEHEIMDIPHISIKRELVI